MRCPGRRARCAQSAVAAPRDTPARGVGREGGELSERFELRPGAIVVGPNGALGWLDAVLAIPGSGQVSGFVLREGLLFDRGIRVPIEAVERTEYSRVHVWLSAAQLNDLADMQ